MNKTSNVTRRPPIICLCCSYCSLGFLVWIVILPAKCSLSQTTCSLCKPVILSFQVTSLGHDPVCLHFGALPVLPFNNCDSFINITWVAEWCVGGPVEYWFACSLREGRLYARVYSRYSSFLTESKEGRKEGMVVCLCMSLLKLTGNRSGVYAPSRPMSAEIGSSPTWPLEG